MFILQTMRVVVALLRKKLRNRIRILPHMDDLKNDVAAVDLPKALGGELDFEWERDWVKPTTAREAVLEAAGKDPEDPVWLDVLTSPPTA